LKQAESYDRLQSWQKFEIDTVRKAAEVTITPSHSLAVCVTFITHV